MAWVDVTQDVRWFRHDLERRAERELAFQFPDADRLRRRASALATGTTFMTPADKARWDAYQAADGALAAQVEDELATMGNLEGAFAVEAAQLALQTIPDDADPDHVAQRAAQQAIIDAASPDVMAIVNLRNRVPPPPPTTP